MSPFQRVRTGSIYITSRARKFFAAETRGMHEAAYLLAAFAFASQFLGLVRDRTLAASFGAGHTLDIYYAAFLVPNFLFSTVASLLSLYALMPVLSRLEEEQKGLMVSFLRDLALFFIVGMTLVSLVAFALAPILVPLISPGLAADAATRAELILLMRILLLQPILLGISNTISSLTQLRHRFILYSISPLLYNLGIIFGAIFLYPRLGISGLGLGVVLGALMHMAVQLPFFFTEHAEGRVGLPRLAKLSKEIFALSVPRTLALASNQISLLVILALASFLAPGSITIFNFAYNLQSVPLTIIGISYSVAAFPTFVRLYAQGAKVELARYAEAALRHIIFWSVPCTVFMIVLRAQIVRTVLGAGQFNWDATRLTAAALALFIISLLAQSATFLISRAYYAIGNTKKPFYIGLADICISIIAAVGLLYVFKTNFFFMEFVEALLRVNDIAGTSVLMLALGYALGSIAEFLIGYTLFVKDFAVSHANFNRLFFETFAASLIGGAVSYGILSATGQTGTINTTIGIFTQGFIAGIGGIAVTVVLLWILKSKELREVLGALKRKFADAPQVVAVEPSDVA
ncbi:MAG TPA: lipid II flippase MurJ [Candidatus Paceibacterota bacterium]|jgi:putative peptidoglycan lipid II flippase|nr:lipid II flippase MurJ [Candidatus Paceibacterota bacterium]